MVRRCHRQDSIELIESLLLLAWGCYRQSGRVSKLLSMARVAFEAKQRQPRERLVFLDLKLHVLTNLADVKSEITNSLQALKDLLGKHPELKGSYRRKGVWNKKVE